MHGDLHALAFFCAGEPPVPRGQEKSRSSVSTFRTSRTLPPLSSVSCESIKTSPGFGCLYSCLNLSFSQQLMNLALSSNFLGCCTMSLQGPIAHLIPCARAAAHWSAALPAEFNSGHLPPNHSSTEQALCS